jgi:hypothetical protein
VLIWPFALPVCQRWLRVSRIKRRKESEDGVKITALSAAGSRTRLSTPGGPNIGAGSRKTCGGLRQLDEQNWRLRSIVAADLPSLSRELSHQGGATFDLVMIARCGVFFSRTQRSRKLVHTNRRKGQTAYILTDRIERFGV